MATYPGSIWSAPSRGANLSDATTHTGHHDQTAAEVVAIETQLGTSPTMTLKAIGALFTTGGAVSAFTPTWANVSLGSGASSFGAYITAGKICTFSAAFVLGTGGVLTGNLALTLPVEANGSARVVGSAYYLDSGTREWVGLFRYTSSTTVGFVHTETGNAGLVNATNPMTWTIGDQCFVCGTYPTV